jgi:hypothetical protein
MNRVYIIVTIASRLKDKAKDANTYLEKDDIIKAFDSKSFDNKLILPILSTGIILIDLNLG